MSLKTLSSPVKNTLIILGLLLLGVGAYYISGVIAPFLISLVLAYIINPLITRLIARKIPRPFAVLLVFVICIIIFVVFVVPFTLSMVSEAGDLLNNLSKLDVKAMAAKYKEAGSDIYEKIQHIPYVKEHLNGYLAEFVQSDNIRELAAKGVIVVKDSTVSGFQYIGNFIIGAFSGMMNMILIPILMFYILIDIDQVFAGFKMLLPPDYKEKFLNIAQQIDTQLSSLLRGQLFSNAVFAVLMTIGLWISGLKFALFLGLMAGIANFIPYLGGLFTVVFAIFVAITQYGFSMALLSAIIKVAIAIAVVQTIDGWYLQPYVVGENAGLHPLVVMLALAIAAKIGGIPGMLLAVPITVILKVLGKELYHELYDRSENAVSNPG